MNSNLKEQLLFLLTGLILGFIMFSSLKCGKHTDNQVVIHDTIEHKSIYVDTIKTLEYRDRWHLVIQPKDSIKLLPKDTSGLAFLRVYKDSLITKDLSITTLDSVYGKLKSQKLNYLLKKQVINKTIRDSIFITKTISQKHDLFELWGGLYTGGTSTSFNSISPYIKLNIRNKDYSYRYNILQNSHEIGVGFKIW